MNKEHKENLIASGNYRSPFKIGQIVEWTNKLAFGWENKQGRIIRKVGHCTFKIQIINDIIHTIHETKLRRIL